MADLSTQDINRIVAAIDRDELTALVLQLCNIASPMRRERAAGDYVYDWMNRNGFAPRRIGLTPDRFNVVGRYGSGPGPHLLFTSHLDTESPFYDETDRYSYRDETLNDRQWLEAWLEGETFFGHAVGNDRGPMACFLLAAKALKSCGIGLNGTMYLTACPGEIGPEPAEERQGLDYLGKELGAAYLLAHGGVAPDYVIAAEGTDFGINWTACGYADFRITLTGEGTFAPLINHPDDLGAHPSPLVRIAPLIDVVQRWAQAYERRNRYESEGGVSVPKVQIGALRGGTPNAMGAGSEICVLYLHVTLTAIQTIGAVDRDLKDALRQSGFGDACVEPIVVRHGFEADTVAVNPLRSALDSAHRHIRGQGQPIGPSVFASMWRDHNVFNMNRIPAVTMGPTRWRPTIDDLLDCTKIYALAALALCGKAPS